MVSRLALCLLGPPHIERDGVPVKLDRRKAIALLAYLAVTGQSHRRESLVNLLWPEYDGARGRAALRRTLYALNQQQDYDPVKFLTPKTNYLRPKNDDALPFPVRAHIDNDSDPKYTVIEVQAIDRLGLLHDLLHTINRHGLRTTHARITTEKGAALDTLFVHDENQNRLTDIDRLTALQTDLSTVIGAD